MTSLPSSSIIPSRLRYYFRRLFFHLSIIFKNISSKKLNSLIVIFGLVFSLTSLFVSSIWIETNKSLISDQYIESLDYEMYITSYMPYRMNEIYEFVISDPLVSHVDYIYQTEALFNFEDKSPEYRFFPENNQEDPSNPISITSAILLPSSSIDRIGVNFNFEGNLSLRSNEILISDLEARELERIYNRSIVPGTTISLAVTKRIPYTDGGEVYLKYFDLNIYSNFTVAAIYTTNSARTILNKLLGGSGSSPSPLDDSIIFPLEAFSSSDLYTLERNGLLPKLLVKTRADKMRENGISQMVDSLAALRDRVTARFYFSNCILLDDEIQSMVDEYGRISKSFVLFIPSVIVSMLLVIVSSNITINQRREEVGILRVKGALPYQIILLFFSEFVVLSFISLVISFGLSIVLSGILTGPANFSLFYGYLQIPVSSIELNTITVLGIYLVSMFLKLYSFISQEVKESFIISTRGRKAINKSLFVLIFILLIVGFIFELLDFKESTDNYSRSFSSMILSVRLFLLFIGLCLISLYLVALILNFILIKIKPIYSLLLKKSSFFIHKNIQRPRKSFSSLTLFLLIASSLLSFTLALQTSLLKNIADEQYYLQGADLRIISHSTNISSFEEKIERIDGIEQAMGIYSTTAKIASLTIELFGVDPLKYLDIGRWIDVSFVNSSALEALQKLDSDPFGICISDYLAERLGFSIDQSIYISDFFGRASFLSFNISSLIRSAPGLGFAHGVNSKVGRYVEEYILLNKDILSNYLGVSNGTLFFASVSEPKKIESIKEQLLQLDEVVSVNPEKINPNYIGYFILQFVPDVWAILTISVTFILIISVVYIFMSTNYILQQRREEYALLLALGANPKKVRKMIFFELNIYILFTLFFGMFFGILSALCSLYFVKPLLITQEIIPLRLHVNSILLLLIIIVFLFTTLLSSLSIIKAQTKTDIINELRIEK
ncbi:MAG: FtsX-like permease family protein [Candidatus Heimdallarchaeaceae archaeon]